MHVDEILIEALHENRPLWASLAAANADIFTLADARYSKGIDNYLVVLDAQRSFYGAQQGLITIRLLRMRNLVTLYKVLGGGSEVVAE